MSRGRSLGRATRLAAAFCLALVGVVMVWRYTATGGISGSDLAGGAVCIVVYLLSYLFPEEGEEG